jgi:hypothetical protein
MAENPLFLSSRAFARLAGFDRATVSDYCLRYRGFGFRGAPRGWWRIPFPHLARLMNGESLAEIASAPSVPPLGVPTKTPKWLQEEAGDAIPGMKTAKGGREPAMRCWVSGRVGQ